MKRCLDYRRMLCSLSVFDIRVEQDMGRAVSDRSSFYETCCESDGFVVKSEIGYSTKMRERRTD